MNEVESALLVTHITHLNFAYQGLSTIIIWHVPLHVSTDIITKAESPSDLTKLFSREFIASRLQLTWIVDDYCLLPDSYAV